LKALKKLRALRREVKHKWVRKLIRKCVRDIANDLEERAAEDVEIEHGASIKAGEGIPCIKVGRGRKRRTEAAEEVLPRPEEELEEAVAVLEAPHTNATAKMRKIHFWTAQDEDELRRDLRQASGNNTIVYEAWASRLGTTRCAVRKKAWRLRTSDASAAAEAAVLSPRSRSRSGNGSADVSDGGAVGRIGSGGTDRQPEAREKQRHPAAHVSNKVLVQGTKVQANTPCRGFSSFDPSQINSIISRLKLSPPSCRTPSAWLCLSRWLCPQREWKAAQSQLRGLPQ
jgi:hypothetical protein